MLGLSILFPFLRWISWTISQFILFLPWGCCLAELTRALGECVLSWFSPCGNLICFEMCTASQLIPPKLSLGLPHAPLTPHRALEWGVWRTISYFSLKMDWLAFFSFFIWYILTTQFKNICGVSRFKTIQYIRYYRQKKHGFWYKILDYTQLHNWSPDFQV